jgi:hypothetical protein
MQKKLSNLKSNLQGTYQQKPKKILKLNESSIFRFYKGKGKISTHFKAILLMTTKENSTWNNP